MQNVSTSPTNTQIIYRNTMGDSSGKEESNCPGKDEGIIILKPRVLAKHKSGERLLGEKKGLPACVFILNETGTHF